MGSFFRVHRWGVIGFFFLIACSQRTNPEEELHKIREKGTELFAAYGCITCHSLQGKNMYGPPLNGIYLKKLTVIRKGKEGQVIADRKYLKRSILEPEFEKDTAYQLRSMQNPKISKDDVDALVDFLITFKE